MAYKDQPDKNEEGMQEKLIQVNRVAKVVKGAGSASEATGLGF